MKNNKSKPVQCVISYSHRDKVLMEKFKDHLDMISRTYPLEIWLDEKIKAGTALDPEIEKKFNTCEIVFILVSVYYIKSDYCYEKELRMAYERHNKSKCVIVPVILSDVKIIDELPFGNLKRVPKDGRPIRNFKPQDKGLAEADEMIIELLKDFKIDNSMQQIPVEKFYKLKTDNDDNQSFSGLKIPVYKIVKDGIENEEIITQDIIDTLPDYCKHLNQFDSAAKEVLENSFNAYKTQFYTKNYVSKKYLRDCQFKFLRNFLFELSNAIQKSFIGDVNCRIHFRRLSDEVYEGIVVSGNSNNREIAKNLTKISSQSGMIYKSGVLDKPLLRSFNNDLHIEGQNDKIWVEHLTCTFKITDTITPIISMGISLKSHALEIYRPVLILMAYTRFDLIVRQYIMQFIKKCSNIDTDFVIDQFIKVDF